MRELFELYGFEYMEAFSRENADVYVIKQGVFDNAYIVSKRPHLDVSECVQQLRLLGYATKELRPTSLNEVREELFSGFFQKEKSKRKIIQEYEKYVEKVIHSYPANSKNYTYISAPFLVDGEVSIDIKIVDTVINKLSESGPKLILIEAGAGFGKTSTAFEICRTLSLDSNTPVVMLAELSRDRQAKIFRHVLLEEIDRSFPSLSSSLVEEEMKHGNVLVVLDGFDELLRKNEESQHFEQSEAMLETIAKLLIGNAKVILTTRKTAVLEGEEFYKWADSHSKDFEVSRLSLLEPRIRDWLSWERITALENSGVNLVDVSNPVLLSYLSFSSEAGFSKLLEDPNSLHDRYFASMLEREQERQQLHMSPEQQSDLLTRLAADMANRNYTKDKRQEIMRYFIEQEESAMEAARLSYHVQDRPTMDELALKLSNHALLDRSSSDDRIGFVNDFVLGSFVGKSIISFPNPDWFGEELFIESAIEAFASKTEIIKNTLWAKLTYVLGMVSDQNRISMETRLFGHAVGLYENTSVNEQQFNEIKFWLNGGSIHNTTFFSCVFTKCIFNASKISECHFINCRFYDCQNIEINDDISSKFISCYEERGDIVSREIYIQPEISEQTNEIWRFILEKFWPVGKESITFAHRPNSIFYGKKDAVITSEAVAAGIEQLKKEQLLIDAMKKSWIGINTAKLGEIATILGRN